MFKIFGLIGMGILLAASGLYVLSVVGLPVIILPNVNWAMVGLAMLVGGVASFGTAFVVSRMN
jgi:hypothetical protein